MRPGDVTHFSRCRAAPNCFAIVDLVSRKWICALLQQPRHHPLASQLIEPALHYSTLKRVRRA